MQHNEESRRLAAALRALEAYRERFSSRLITRFVWRLQAFSDRKAVWALLTQDEKRQELYASALYGKALLERFAPHLQPVGYAARLGFKRQQLSDADINAAEQSLRDTLNGRTFPADFPPKEFQASPFSAIETQLKNDPMAFFDSTSQGVNSVALDHVEQSLPDPTDDGWQRTWLVMASLIVAINDAEHQLLAKLGA